MADFLFYSILRMQSHKHFVESPYIPLIIYIWHSEPCVFSSMLVIYIDCHPNCVYSWTIALSTKPAISQYGFENVKTVTCSSFMFCLFWFGWMWCSSSCLRSPSHTAENLMYSGMQCYVSQRVLLYVLNGCSVFETSGNTHQLLQCHIPEDWNLLFRCVLQQVFS
jgi:hypothetical protein